MNFTDAEIEYIKGAVEQCDAEYDAAPDSLLEKLGIKSMWTRSKCQGHPAGPNDPMGETTFCDGKCKS